MSRDKRPDRETAPEGLQQGVCCDVVDLGLRVTPWGPKEKVEIRWILDSVDSKGRGFMVSARYTNSLNEKATLRRHLEAWRGKKFTPEEVKNGWDLEKLLGANGQLQVVHKLGEDGTTYANVHTVVPLGKGMPKMEIPSSYVRAKDRNQTTASGHASDMVEDEVPF
jgi:hypothetical protein